MSSRPVSSKSVLSVASARPGSRPASGQSMLAPGSPSSRPGSGKSVLAWEMDEQSEDTDRNAEQQIETESDQSEDQNQHSEDTEDVVDDDIENLLTNSIRQDTGCWYWVTSRMSSLWETKLMNNSGERELEIKTTIRELTIYLMFLAIVAFLVAKSDMTTRHIFTEGLKNQFSDFNDIDQVPALWNYLLDGDGGFVDSLYQEHYYNDGQDIRFMCPELKAEDCYIDTRGRYTCRGPCKRRLEDRNVLWENKLLGVPRIRQIRVRNDTCNIQEAFKSTIAVCYGHYAKESEDKDSFGPEERRFSSGDAWRYQSANELSGADYWGKIGVYGGSGSIQTLGLEKKVAKAIIRELREALWISRATRLVMFDFTVYNANVNLFCIVKLVVEFPPTGGLVASSSFTTVKLLRYVTNMDYIVLGVEGVFVFFILYYIVEETLELSSEGLKYFHDSWNYLDIVVILVSLCNIGIALYVYLQIGNHLKPLLAEPETFGDFTLLGNLASYQDWIFSINVFISFLKIFKYISFNKTMNILSNTLTRCLPDLCTFSFMYFIVEMAFIQLACLLFGQKIENFATITDSSYTMLRCLLGDFDFPAMSSAQPILGPLYFFLYIFFSFFILLNMFLAIINDCYSEVKAELEEAKCQFEIQDFFMRGYNNVIGTVAMRDKSIDIENAIKLANGDGTVTFEEMRAELKKYNFSGQEIDLFFSTNDADGDGIIDIKESNDIIDDLSDDEFDEGIGSSRPGSGKSFDIVTNAEFDRVERRVDRIEHKIGSIVTKIDAVLCRMDRMTVGPREDDQPLMTMEPGSDDQPAILVGPSSPLP